MTTPRDRKWLEAVRSAVDADVEMNVIGGHFTAVISFTFDDKRYDLDIRAGKIVDIVDNPRIDKRADFGFRAPLDVWNKFLQPVPPPLYNSVFGMIMRIPEFCLDGDSLVLAQNARAVTRLVSIMQIAERA